VNFLLDTHSFLWAVFQPGRLSRRGRDILKNPQNAIFVSSVSFWEISLKFALGKLQLLNCSPESLPEAARKMDLQLTPLDAETASSFHTLPKTIHKDPFDRMLIWQAIRTRMTLISKDKSFSDYRDFGLEALW
jgi:PIN domain nuclease of toxin-antitoxin system